jgi:hypothetical protein
MRRPLIGAFAYLAVMTLWIYSVANRWDPGTGGWLLPVIIFIQLLAGLAVGRWWAVALPVLVLLISIPAGNPPVTPEYVEPFPIWFGLGLVSPVAFLLIAVGVAARKFQHWHSSNSRLAT